MKFVMIKTLLFERYGERTYSFGKLNLKDFEAAVQALPTDLDMAASTRVCQLSDYRDSNAIHNLVYDACRFVPSLDSYPDSPQSETGCLLEMVEKLKAGETIGLWDEESIAAFVPMIRMKGEKRQAAYDRAIAAANAMLYTLERADEEDEDLPFDAKDWK